MTRVPRSATGNIVYHVLNRANGRMQIFQKDGDYFAFEQLLQQAKEKYPMRILAYCLMPNHWHLLLYPEGDNDLPRFMRWLTLTHTQRWHLAHKTVGYGHLYQGRYKSFPVQTDEHFLQVARYIERNALRAGLVERAEQWHWSSMYRRISGTPKDKKLFTSWPIIPDENYVEWVNAPQPKEEVEGIRYVILRGRPYGSEAWVHAAAQALHLEPTLRPRGRPRKE